jgi:serine/threonine-protein kinase
MWSGVVIGETINNYRVRSVLGEGGMGFVYLAEHPFMGRKAAVKVLRPEHAADKNLVDRFMNEARAANTIGHPNIIDIIDVGRLPNGVPYLMMEFLDGLSLSKIVARGRLSVPDAVEVAAQTAAALQAAHSKGIVHRDLKPDNLFLVRDPARPLGRVKVLDFGIAKLRGDLGSSNQHTRDGAVMGTPPYMSPEQCRGLSSEVDSRTDIYALGIIVYEMLSGAPPFTSEGWGDVMMMHVSQAPPSLRERDAEVSAELEAVIMKSLAKRREDRWGSMAEFEAALRTPSAIASVPGWVPPAASGRRAVASTQVLPTPLTTLRNATGQVGAHENEDSSLESPQRGKRRTLIFAGGALAAAAVAAAASFGGSGGRRSRVSETPAVTTPSAAAPAPSLMPATATAMHESNAVPPAVSPVTPKPAAPREAVVPVEVPKSAATQAEHVEAPANATTPSASAHPHAATHEHRRASAQKVMAAPPHPNEAPAAAASPSPTAPATAPVAPGPKHGVNNALIIR